MLTPKHCTGIPLTHRQHERWAQRDLPELIAPRGDDADAVDVRPSWMDLEVETFLFEVSETLGDDFTELVTPGEPSEHVEDGVRRRSTERRNKHRACRVKMRRQRENYGDRGLDSRSSRGGERIASPKCRQAQTMIFRPCRERRRRSWDLPADHASRRWMSL